MTTAVTSSTAPNTSGSGLAGAMNPGGVMGKDQFVKLLVAQMTHQDPMNPADGTQMAAQLAQFSSVEQLMNIGSKLDAQANGSAAVIEAMDRTAALGMIGRTVTAVSDEITVSAHTAGAVQTEVPNAGGHVYARIVDAVGNEISRIDCGTQLGGRRTLDLSKGLKSVPDGSFTIKVEVVDGQGAVTPLSAIQQFAIDGLRFGTNGAVLTSGSRSVPITNVIGVSSH
jgi:flagellar basal-body rod modification protein FlgD